MKTKQYQIINHHPSSVQLPFRIFATRRTLAAVPRILGTGRPVAPRTKTTMGSTATLRTLYPRQPAPAPGAGRRTRFQGTPVAGQPAADPLLERMLAAVAGPGPLPAMVADHLSSGGKRVRARLIEQAGECLGLSADRLQPWAAACELLHNATLVHDDVQDGDAMRRGQPALWVRHGMAQAINAGDAMLLAPMRALDTPGYAPIERWELTRALVDRSILTACGQSQEQMLIQQAAPTWAEYQEAARAKTGPFFALAIEGVLILAGWSGPAARRASDGLLELGLLFQLSDDLEDLWGQKGREAPGADLREGKVSALVAATIEHDPARGEALMTWLRRPRTQRTPEQVQDWTDYFVQSGVRARVLARWRQGMAELPQRSASLPPELQRLVQATADGLARKLAGIVDR